MSDEYQKDTEPVGNVNFHNEVIVSIMLDNDDKADEVLTEAEQMNQVEETSKKSRKTVPHEEINLGETGSKTKITIEEKEKEKGCKDIDNKNTNCSRRKKNIRLFYRPLNRFLFDRFGIKMKKLNKKILEKISQFDIKLLDLFDKRKLNKVNRRLQAKTGNILTSWKYFIKCKYKDLCQKFIDENDEFPLTPKATVKICTFPKNSLIKKKAKVLDSKENN